MSTHSKLDKICVAIVICCLVLTALFINGEALGITKIVDEDAEQNSDSEYFTAKDQDGDWDTADATVITLTGDGAEISGTGAYANDGNVVITSAGYYVVSGTLTDGYLSVDAYDSSKVFIRLNGAEINCSDDACIRVDQADKVFLTLAEGSENTLASGSTYSDAALKDGTDGAIFAHDDLTINGSGSLIVNADYRHGIAANDDLVITGGTITVTAAADAIHAKDSLRIKDASITVDAGDDGIVTSNEEENGYLYIESGTLTVTAADDGIHTTGDITLAGGDIRLSAGDDGIHSDASVFISDGTLLIEDCYEGIEALIIDVSGGDITIYPQDDGFNANGNSDSQIGAGGMGGGGMRGGMGGGMGGGEMRDSMRGGAGGMGGGKMRGGMGSAQTDTSNAGLDGTDTEASDGGWPTPPDMGSADSTGGMQMQAPPDMGSMDSTSGMQMQAPPDMSSADSTGSMQMQAPPDMGSVDSTGSMQAPPEMPQMGSLEGSTGAEASKEFNTEGADSTTSGPDGADSAASDPAAAGTTSSDDEETYISISGGTITIINETGSDADGLDSNGDIRISGGTIYVSLQGSGSNSAVDYGSESGGVAEITGGTIIACGASSMAEAFDSSSTQASILYNTSTVAEAGTTLAIEDADSNVLLSWEVPCSFSSALVSCPQMETGGTYTVVIGDTEEEITLEEVSASYGDAQSSMFGGNMNWGGMQPRGGGPGGRGFRENASSGSTDAAAAPSMQGTQGGPESGMTPPAMSDNSQSSSTAGAGEQMPSAPSDMSQSGSTAAAGEQPSGMSQDGMKGGPMQDQQQNQQNQQDQSREQTQDEEDQTAAIPSTAEPVDAQTWGILGACLAVLLAGIAVSRFYKRH